MKTIDEQIVFAILTQTHGSLKAQIIWNGWNIDQRYQATEVARQLRPTLEKTLDELAAWIDDADPAEGEPAP